MQDRARQALRLADADPSNAAELARAVADEARTHRDLAAMSVAERALGLAILHLEGPDAALPHLRAAIRLARRAGSAQLAAEARMTLAITLNMRGRGRQALREIDAAVADLTGVPLARARAQRGAILNQLGLLDAALPDYQAALAVLRQAGDHEWLQRVLYNRAVLYGYRQEFDAAETDLHEAEQLCIKYGLEVSLAFVHENLGWLNGLRGDVPAALHYLDLAERRLRAHDMPVGQLLTDRCQLLLSARLTTEACQAAEEAVQEFADEHRQLALPEARLLLAQAAVLDGQPARGLAEAHAAVREFTYQKRPRWATLARFTAIQASVTLAGRPSSATSTKISQLERIATELAADGWPNSAVEAHLLAGQQALNRGRAARAVVQLQQAARRQSRRVPSLERARAWHAEALLRLAGGNGRGAASAARTALRILDEQRTALGATDLRAHAAGHRLQIAELGLRLAFDGGRTDRILEWAEHGRASHLMLRPVRPPADPELAATEADLRATVTEIAKLRRAGRSTTSLRRRQIELEQQIRDRHRQHRGDPLASPVLPVRVRDLIDLVREVVLLEFVQLDDALHVIVVTQGRLHLHRIGSAAKIHDLVDRARFALHRLARQHASPATLSAAGALLSDAANRLDELLLRPAAAQFTDQPIVVVPTGHVQSLPWSILPTCAGRPVTVAPSAALWCAAQQSSTGVPGRRRNVLVAAGPGLPGADAEARAVAAIHQVTPITRTAATVGTVMAGLDGADLAHLGAHGNVHPRNPLFSALTLADGPLTAYDLQRLRQAPRLVILAACDVGQSTVQPGDELMGLSATFLALGTSNIVASVAPLPDGETAPLMIEFHRRLAAGQSAASALAQSQQQLNRDHAAAVAAAAGFVSIGADSAISPIT